MNLLLSLGRPVLVAGPPRTATSWTAKVLSHGWVRYVREPILQGRPSGYDPAFDNLFLDENDEHPALRRVWLNALSMRTRLSKRWLYSESRTIFRRVPILPARLLVKEVNTCLSLAWLEREFDFQTVITVRHPCAFLASARKLRSMGHPTLVLESLLRQERLMQRNFSEQAAWLSRLSDEDEKLFAAYCMLLVMLETQAARHPAWVVCRHETVCSDPIGQFSTVFSRLKLPFSARAEQFVRASTQASDGETYGLSRNAAEEADKWRKDFESAQLARFGEIARTVGATSYEF